MTKTANLAAATALAAVAATIVNVLIRAIAVAALDIPQPEFEPLQLRDVIVSSIGATIAAGIAFAIVARLASDPVRTYLIVATVALVLSLAAPLTTDGDAAGKGTLVAMHVVTAAICVGVFTRGRGSAPPRR